MTDDAVTTIEVDNQTAAEIKYHARLMGLKEEDLIKLVVDEYINGLALNIDQDDDEAAR